MNTKNEVNRLIEEVTEAYIDKFYSDSFILEVDMEKIRHYVHTKLADRNIFGKENDPTTAHEHKLERVIKARYKSFCGRNNADMIRWRAEQLAPKPKTKTLDEPKQVSEPYIITKDNWMPDLRPPNPDFKENDFTPACPTIPLEKIKFKRTAYRKRGKQLKSK